VKASDGTSCNGQDDPTAVLPRGTFAALRDHVVVAACDAQELQLPPRIILAEIRARYLQLRDTCRRV